MQVPPSDEAIEMGWSFFQQAFSRKFGDDVVEKNLNLAIYFFKLSIEISGNWYSYDNLPDVLLERGLPGDAEEAENVKRQFSIINKLFHQQ